MGAGPFRRGPVAGPPDDATAYKPDVFLVVSPNGVMPFAGCPLGVILHGTRSGQAWGIAKEFVATYNYVRGGASGLGWNATIGEDSIAIHIAPDAWGWNARAASGHWLAVEFAQGRLEDEIADAQVRAFCWWFREVARKRWPELPLNLIAHSELPEGRADGKSDVFPNGSQEITALRRRIMACL